MAVKENDKLEAAKYLLGDMPETEQSRYEERFFHDAELSELLSEVEDDLIDQYVRNELSDGERERFEHHFLISERRRTKVEFARALIEVEAATKSKAVSKDYQPSRKSIFSFLSVPSPALAYSFGAIAFLLFIGGLWLFSENRQLRREVAQLEIERKASEQHADRLRAEATEQRERGDNLAGQKEKLEQEFETLRQQYDDATADLISARTFLSFILVPGQRGSQGGPKKLLIPSGVQTIRLQLNLNPDDEYSGYQARLQTASGNQVRTWNGLKAGSGRSKNAVFVVVPVRLLSAGQYELALNGVAQTGSIEDIGYYYFEVTKD